MKIFALLSILIVSTLGATAIATASAAAARLTVDPDFISVPEQFIFRQDGPNLFTAETATADFGLTSQSGAFFGSLQIVSRGHIRLNLSGQYFELQAYVRRTGP